MVRVGPCAFRDSYERYASLVERSPKLALANSIAGHRYRAQVVGVGVLLIAVVPFFVSGAVWGSGSWQVYMTMVIFLAVAAILAVRVTCALILQLRRTRLIKSIGQELGSRPLDSPTTEWIIKTALQREANN